MARSFFIFAVSMAISAPVLGAAFHCTSRDNLEMPVRLEVSVRTAALKWGGYRCPLKQISYNPVSPKYEGWKRFGTPGKNVQCTELSSLMFGNKAALYWVSVSTEVQGGVDGFAQIGFENIYDPGAGREAKIWVRCRALNK